MSDEKKIKEIDGLKSLAYFLKIKKLSRGLSEHEYNLYSSTKQRINILTKSLDTNQKHSA